MVCVLSASASQGETGRYTTSQLRLQGSGKTPSNCIIFLLESGYMTPASTVFEGKSSKGLEVLIRYPALSDCESMCDYINTLSEERTFVTYQGEKETLESEQKLLNHVLKEIEDKKAVMLLCFHQNKLIGISHIEMEIRTERHTGIFALSVAKEYRGKGVGEILMSIVLEESIKHIPDLEIVTICFFSSNTVARSLYEKMGFTEYGTLPNGVKLEKGYADQVMMYKVVRAPSK